jgi:hypothetical protein
MAGFQPLAISTPERSLYASKPLAAALSDATNHTVARAPDPLIRPICVQKIQ